jgi:hypothetical protein
MSLRLALIVLSIAASPALAFDTTKLGQWGSLGLDDISSLLDKAPQLRREVDAALAKADRKLDEVRCTGMRFPGSWVNLGGERVAPYVCNIGDRWIEIRTRVRVTGRKGKAIEKIDRQAMKQATEVSETDPAWTWSDKDPRPE